MTRKHFEALAEALRISRPAGFHEPTGGGERENAKRQQWLSDREAIAGVCARFNGAFDRGRFLVWTEK